MNILKKQMMSKLALLLMLFMGYSALSMAAVKLYIEDFTFAYNETQKQVALILENDKEVTQFQADLTLPDDLTVASVVKADRLTGRGVNIEASQVDGKIRILKTGGNAIAAGSGEVITITFTNTLAAGDYEILFSNIVISDANADDIATEHSWTTNVTKDPEPDVSSCKFGAVQESIEVTVGKEYQIDITLDNEGVENLSAFSGNLTLPEGFTVVSGTDGKFIYSNRLPDPLEFSFKEYDGYTRFVLSSSSNTLITGTEGVVFSFKIKADNNAAETSTITLSDLRITTNTGNSDAVGDVTISVKNLSAAFEAYKEEQAAAVNKLAEEGDSEDAQAIIAAAVEAINALTYDESKTLAENKAVVDALVEPVDGLLEAQRAADAAAAQLAADKEEFAEYQAEQAAAVEALAEEGDSEAARQIIADAVEALEALEYDEELSLAENKAAVDAIVAPVADALAEQRAADQLAADKATFEAYKEEAKALAEQLGAADETDESKALVAAAKDEIDAAVFDADLTLDENKEALDDILTKLTADLNAQRNKDNVAAYATLSAELDVLDAAIADARETLSADKYALVSDEFLAQLDDLKAKVDAARADLGSRYANGELTSSSTNIESTTLEEVAAILAAADAAQDSVAGDIDSDGEITLDDFDSFVDELLNNDDLWDAADDPELYEQYEKYDVNGDGRIDVADAQALINLSLGLNIDGTTRHARTLNSGAAHTLTAQAIRMGNGVTRYIVSLSEYKTFASFQMKVKGNVVGISSDNASLKTRMTADGCRVLGFAQNNTLESSVLLVVDVMGEALFSHICFSTPDAASVSFGMDNVTTGITIVSTASTGEDIYDLSGKKLGSQTKGINIVRRADGKVRKVMMK